MFQKESGNLLQAGSSCLTVKESPISQSSRFSLQSFACSCIVCQMRNTLLSLSSPFLWSFVSQEPVALPALLINEWLGIGIKRSGLTGRWEESLEASYVVRGERFRNNNTTQRDQYQGQGTEEELEANLLASGDDAVCNRTQNTEQGKQHQALQTRDHRPGLCSPVRQRVRRRGASGVLQLEKAFNVWIRDGSCGGLRGEERREERSKCITASTAAALTVPRELFNTQAAPFP